MRIFDHFMQIGVHRARQEAICQDTIIFHARDHHQFAASLQAFFAKCVHIINLWDCEYFFLPAHSVPEYSHNNKIYLNAIKKNIYTGLRYRRCGRSMWIDCSFWFSLALLSFRCLTGNLSPIAYGHRSRETKKKIVTDQKKREKKKTHCAFRWLVSPSPCIGTHCPKMQTN